MVVAAYGLILPPAVLELPRLGCWTSRFAVCRAGGSGADPPRLLAGDTETGITIMQMDAGLDTGPMLLKRPTAIGEREDGGTLHDRLAALGAAAIVAAIAEFQAGRLTPAPQPADGVTYASKIRKEEARIDWTAPARAIDRQVRAFNPWPVAETRWQDRQLRVWAAEPLRAASGEPGQVVEANGAGIVVAAGEGALRLTRVQLAGRRAMTAAEFLNAHPLAGARFG